MINRSENPGVRNSDYINRINGVMDYVETHLDENLSLENLSQIACFSRFHFHRVFQSITGERLAAFIQRVRLEKAASLLRSNPRSSITEIAVRCGFASSASFANAFKRWFGRSASEFRLVGRDGSEERYIRSPFGYSESLDVHVEHGRNGLSYRISGNGYERVVDVVELPPWDFAYVRYTGTYRGDTQLFSRLWNKLTLWAAPRGILNRPDPVYLTLCHDDPGITIEEKLRVSVCVGIDERTTTSGEVGRLKLPGGSYAICRFLLGSNDYPDAWGWMYGSWLPLSGYVPDDRIAFEWFPPRQSCEADAKNAVDICIPVRPGSPLDYPE